MNCKQGDIAVVVRTGKYTKQMLGRVIRVTQRGPDVSSMPGLGMDITATWEYEPKLQDDFGNNVLLANDACLRPIRDPGDDARDETLAWKPVPKTVPLAKPRQLTVREA